jgi:hypothetical protein
VFTGFRNIYLGDYYNKAYIRAFNSVQTIQDFVGFSNSDWEFEDGYMLLNIIAKTIINDFRFFQVLYTGLALILLYFVVKRLEFEENEKNLFLFVYFCMRFVINNFIILRQNIANLIIWNVILSNAGILITIIFVFVASKFHITSLVNFVTIGIMKILEKLNNTYVYIITIVLSLILLTTSTSVINGFINYFVELSSDKYSKYFISEGTYNGFNWTYYFLRILFYTLLFLYFDVFEYKKKKELFLVSSVAVILGSINVEIFSRFMEYFMIGIYGVMTVSYQAFTENTRKYYLILLYFALMIIMLRQLLIYGDGFMLEYSFFWK